MSRTGSIRNPESRYIIRHQQFSEICKPVNLFENVPSHRTAFEEIKQYLVVGDPQFKKKYCEDKRNETNNSMVTIFDGKLSSNNQNKLLSTLEQTNLNTLYENKNKTYGDVSQNIQQTCRFGNSQGKAMFRFHLHREKQKRIDNFLRKRLSQRANLTVEGTMTLDKKQIQICSNPKLIDLINSNVPEYWQHSLRDNHTRLKRHIKGNQYAKYRADQMLQTEKGRKQLIGSIPKLKQQLLMQVKQRRKTVTNKIALAGRRLQTLNESFPCYRSKTQPEYIPKLYCEQVFKIQYDSKYRVSKR